MGRLDRFTKTKTLRPIRLVAGVFVDGLTDCREKTVGPSIMVLTSDGMNPSGLIKYEN